MRVSIVRKSQFVGRGTRAGRGGDAGRFGSSGAADCGRPRTAIRLPATHLDPAVPSSNWDISGAGSSAVQGCTTQMSVNDGETASFKVNTDAAFVRHARSDDHDGPDGVHHYGTGGGFPGDSWQSGNYRVDVTLAAR